MTSLPQFTLVIISLLVIFVYYQGNSAPNEMSTLFTNCQEQISSLGFFQIKNSSLGVNVCKRDSSHIIRAHLFMYHII